RPKRHYAYTTIVLANIEVDFQSHPKGHRLAIFHRWLELSLTRRGNRFLCKAIGKTANHPDALHIAVVTHQHTHEHRALSTISASRFCVTRGWSGQGHRLYIDASDG